MHIRCRWLGFCYALVERKSSGLQESDVKLKTSVHDITCLAPVEQQTFIRSLFFFVFFLIL